ncbi:hypothetical protein [Deinococcus aquiradiocola]|uniref:Uncharacterized protein n=1 Tax=Deinococcus aquiradiocola TaxID=393059 RepID=A0A917USX5_9DEIO|nr:hypothetical protein [Deinococcus aquiradiocola]GGJ82964.1 hypothetical protein GCM10008939_28600 [Deinococcus aquiradiocola]
MSHVWLPLPTDQAVYDGLSTDHYPWTEVYTDLSLRPQFSGVLDVRQSGAAGRFLWVNGELRGGFGQEGELDVRVLPSTFARATVSLTPLDPALAQLVWSCRDGDLVSLPIEWPDARDLFASRRFRGALLGANSCSFWEDGRLVAGNVPRPGEPLQTVTPRARYTHADLEVFWSLVMSASASRLPLTEAWRQAASRLADTHPCLDPFAREVWLDGTTVHSDPEVPVAELRAAMLDQYRTMTALHGVAPRSIPMPEARSHPLWATSGLDE